MRDGVRRGEGRGREKERAETLSCAFVPGVAYESVCARVRAGARMREAMGGFLIFTLGWAFQDQIVDVIKQHASREVRRRLINAEHLECISRDIGSFFPYKARDENTPSVRSSTPEAAPSLEGCLQRGRGGTEVGLRGGG